MNQNVEIIQLSKNNIAVTFNKHAIKALHNGQSQAIKLKQGILKKDITFLFMRDKDFKKAYSEFNKMLGPKRSFWSKLWPFSGKAQASVRESANRKYRDV